MTIEMKRQQFLNKYFSKKILDLIASGVPEEEIGNCPISHEEAIAILEHTISEVGKRSVLLATD